MAAAYFGVKKTTAIEEAEVLAPEVSKGQLGQRLLACLLLEESKTGMGPKSQMCKQQGIHWG
jgi:hypothetical protein